MRTTGAVDVASTLRHVVAALDPTVAVSAIKPLDGIVAAATAPARFRTTLTGMFALIGLAIAAVGLYGIVAYSVSQRTTEIGIRMALGALASDVLAMVLHEGLTIALAGMAVGLPVAYAVSRTFAASLYGVTPTDWVTYALSGAVLLLIALAASWMPAWRGARMNPIVALRAE